MRERTTVRLPEELMDRARRKAAAEKRTLTSLIEEGLRVVTAPKKPKERPVGPLPVSSARGGFKPEFAGLTFSQIEELDDLEYIERLNRGFK
jgi:hypothetical protein